MQLEQLVKRLRREASANPKKAVVLGLLLLVALYYWMPLVGGWWGASEPSLESSPSTGAVSVPAPTPPEQSVAAAVEQGRSWEDLNQSMALDGRTRPTRQLAAFRDPFTLARPVREVAEEASRKKIEAPVPTITARDLGVLLSSTVLGGRPRLAVINGRTYREGDVFELTKGGQTFALQLVEVRDREAVLLCRGQKIPVAMAPRKVTGRLELSGNRP